MIENLKVDDIIWSLMAAVISAITWLAIRVLRMPSRQEISSMIANESPYYADRALIRAQLQHLTDSHEKIGHHLELLSEQINQTKVLMERIRVEMRIERGSQD
jgi:hypothetical protein